MQKPEETDYNRVFFAVFLAAALLIYWQAKIEWPRRVALSHLNAQINQQRTIEQTEHANEVSAKESVDAEENPSLTRQQRLDASPRLTIHSDKLHGSISLKGARFDDLSLSHYREKLEADSPDVVLFSPNGDDNAYFAQTGWLSRDGKTKVPDQHTLWQADKNELKAGDTVNLRWDNGENVTFVMMVSLDENYMFTITQRLENHSGHDITVLPYSYINRAYTLPKQAPYLHEGPLGVLQGSLQEVTYKELKEKGNKTFDNTSGWFGFADKYWLSAFIPEDDGHKITFSHYVKKNKERYQVDTLDQEQTIADGKSLETSLRLFGGAKELKILDHYATGNTAEHMKPVPLLDRSLDFGYFYFLAKPMCMVVNFLFTTTGNFGVAILLFITLVKAVMFPLANKSYKNMAQMRALQPQIIKIRERYADDQIALHKATRELYASEKINPAAGCLPVLMQIVVFLALFRGLNVTIEMRHAPFFGWLKDLSAPDPSNLFTAFGLVNWDTPAWMHLGLLPMLYCISMIVQTSQQPKPADPVQAKMMTYMPYCLLLFFDKMASGFVLYWTFSNTLSILQQHIISGRHKHIASGTQKAAA